MTEIPRHLLVRAAQAKAKAAAKAAGEPPPDDDAIEERLKAVLDEEAARAGEAARFRANAEQVRVAASLSRARRARRLRLATSFGVAIVVIAALALAMWARSGGGPLGGSREECWAQGGSYLTGSADCLLPPPTTALVGPVYPR